MRSGERLTDRNSTENMGLLDESVGASFIGCLLTAMLARL